MTLTLTPLPDIPMIQTGDDLAAIILQAVEKAGLGLADGDILAIAQKVVSKAEGRWVNLATVTPSARAVELAEQSQKDARVVELILGESREVLRVRPGSIIVEHRLGFVCASAGIDHSNVAGEGAQAASGKASAAPVISYDMPPAQLMGAHHPARRGLITFRRKTGGIQHQHR